MEICRSTLRVDVCFSRNLEYSFSFALLLFPILLPEESGPAFENHVVAVLA